MSRLKRMIQKNDTEKLLWINKKNNCSCIYIHIRNSCFESINVIHGCTTSWNCSLLNTSKLCQHIRDEIFDVSLIFVHQLAVFTTVNLSLPGPTDMYFARNCINKHKPFNANLLYHEVTETQELTKAVDQMLIA